MSEITNEQTIELSELLQIRRDKLAELQENGKNPYDYVKYDVDSSTKEIIGKYDHKYDYDTD